MKNGNMRTNEEILAERKTREAIDKADSNRPSRITVSGGETLKSTTEIRNKMESEIGKYGLGYLKEFSFIDATFKDDKVYAPLDSPHNLLLDVSNEPSLQRCINFKANSVGGMGYHIKQFKLDALNATNETEKEKCDNWTKSVFFPSFNTVVRNCHYDAGYSGMGCILVDFGGDRIGDPETIFYFGRKYIRRWYNAIRVRHVNRMNVFILKPRTDKEGKIIAGYELDTIYPRFFIAQNKNGEGFYCRSFGDPRHVNRKTGAVEARFDEKNQSPMLYRKVEYNPLDPWNGYPNWRTAKTDIDTLFDLRRHDYAYFRKSGIPDIVFIVPEVKAANNTTGADTVESFLKKTAERRELDGGECGAVAVVLEVPMAGIHHSSGKFPITIKEISQKDPSEFIELRRELIQTIVDVNEIPANLVIPYAKNMGSGKDKQEDLRQYKEFYAEPHRQQFNEEFLEQLYLHCCPISGWVANLNMIDTSDPKMLADIADIWDNISIMSNGEKREKIGMDHPILPDDEEKSQDFNNQVFMDFNRIPYDWDEMQRVDTVLEQAQMEQDGVATGNQQAEEFAKMCNTHKIRVDDVKKRVLPFIRTMVNQRSKRERKQDS